MTAATADRIGKVQDGKVLEYGIDGGATYRFYKNTLVTLDTTGYARPGANTEGFRFVGFTELGANQTATASDGDNVVLVRTEGVISLVGAGLAATDVGRPVWLTDDQTISLTATNVGPIGKIIRYVSATEALVDIGKAGHGPAQFLAWAIGTDAFVSDSTTKEVSVGLASAISGFVTNLATAPSLVMGTDLTISSNAITAGRESSGSDETDFAFGYVGY